MSTPFDFINSINSTKINLFEGDMQAEKDYVPFIVNRGLSYFPDTIMYANEMNINSSLPKLWQYTFLLNLVPKKKRFSKWAKKEAKQEDILLVQEYYGYSYEKTKEVMSILTKEQLDIIKKKLFKGGK